MNFTLLLVNRLIYIFRKVNLSLLFQGQRKGFNLLTSSLFGFGAFYLTRKQMVSHCFEFKFDEQQIQSLSFRFAN